MDYGIPSPVQGDPLLLPFERHRPVFTGRAREYFRIWIVNVMLTIVTLGIYSAWAKVRTQRYFYANTRLAGASFEYLANPIAILKGRLIAYAFVIALAVSSRYSVRIYACLMLMVFFATPVIMVLSLRFRARNSAWRGLAFHFDKRVRQAIGPFVGWPILAMLTVWMLYPAAKKRQHAFVIGGHRFGTAAFRFVGDIGDYCKPFFTALGVGIVGWIFFGVVLVSTSLSLRRGDSASFANAMLVYAGVFYLGVLLLTAFVRTAYTNLFWENTRLENHRFECTLRARDMVWLYASNLVAIVCTVGLAAPWAMIRLARYRAEHFSFLARGTIDDFASEAGGDASAAGAELVAVLDVGMDIGF